ncbi:MAG TPA: aminotransferase class V-fold PLP-dependent enzyme [Kofleriaceae bacterium]|jgi:kynureninase|nr:aminotransferase class V-fold PLP-dependent enzyme [Kofleriaceae bacterium]
MADPIAESLLEYRKHFPALEECVHFISHSLGCVPAKAADDLAEFAELWRTKSITAWGDWLPEVDRAAARIAKIISAPDGTVIMHQNVSTVMSVLASCVDFTEKRNKVVYESLMFPTVSYVWQAEKRRGADCVVVPAKDNLVDADAICAAIDERTLFVPIQHVVFATGQIQDVKKIVARAKEVGAHVILDCYQSIGTVPLDVVDLGVSFATGGSVKYVCGGPGAAWLYVRKDLIEQFAPRVTGWFGNEAPFAFTMPEQSYAESVWRYMGGTPAVAALYQSRAGQALIGEIGVRKIREKSLVMTQKCIDWVDELGMKLNSPRPSEVRGGSVVFDFVGSADVCRELNRRKFFCDHRPNAGIRIAPHYYTKPEEVDLFFNEVKKVRGGAGK